jgi:hypothetical protein
MAPAWCALASGFDADSGIAAIFVLVAVCCLFRLLVIRGSINIYPVASKLKSKSTVMVSSIGQQ